MFFQDNFLALLLVIRLLINEFLQKTFLKKQIKI